ncbi:Uma2 family endonuclease [Oceanobacillus sp. CFH 90083]|uniref:Uma2 family endonuclease n=1 Tax=Oceanobacillus sp. CFH 90083 TaxID=2592336 RepID=UPI001D140DF9|nr:Uma2 family endonuclease [Oceanobacillus sp. CFH 90083]
MNLSFTDKNFNTYEEFEEQQQQTDEILEYIDGIIYMSPSPSIKHHRISSFLHGELHHVLKNSSCEVFSAPTDVLFEHNENDHNKNKRIVPDLFVTCHPENFTENEYIGAPDFIIEILSPSNKSHDLARKLNLYMEYGVKEYWIVDPMEKRIMIYTLDENGEVQFDLVSENEKATSRLFENFKIETKILFFD